jgi:hypothetical protein
MEKISLTDRVRDDVLHRVNECRGISYLQLNEGRPDGLVTSCVDTSC